MNITEKSFTCKRNGLTIRGMQYLPDGFCESEKYPAVILCHGFMGNYTSTADFCMDFASCGYAAFCFSFCGSRMPGEKESERSDGNTVDMTVTSEVEDLLAVKDYVLLQPFTDADRLVLAGISQGGFVSGLAAARLGNEIKKLVMIFPALCIPDDARGGRLGGSSYDPQNVPDTIKCEATVLGRAFHEDVCGMDPYRELSAYQGQVLILHGLEDKLVNYSYSVRAQECYRKGQCHLQLIQGLGHGYDDRQRKSMFASILQFLSGRTGQCTGKPAT